MHERLKSIFDMAIHTGGMKIAVCSYTARRDHLRFCYILSWFSHWLIYIDHRHRLVFCNNFWFNCIRSNFTSDLHTYIHHMLYAFSNYKCIGWTRKFSGWSLLRRVYIIIWKWRCREYGKCIIDTKSWMQMCGKSRIWTRSSIQCRYIYNYKNRWFEE